MAQKPYLAAIDYGDKRVGMAIAHVIARLPRPLTTLPSDDRLLDAIRDLVQREDIGLVVVGLPRGMDGGYTEQTKKAAAFAQQLAAHIPVPVEQADETLSSVDAEAALAGKAYSKGDVDAMAAVMILDRYLTEHPAEGATHV